MKKRLLCFLLVFFILLCSVRFFDIKSYAMDPISYMAGLTFSMGNSFGVFTNIATGSAGLTQTWMENSINQYSSFSGKSLTEIFGTEALRLEAGKLIATQRIANGAIEVLNWIVQHYDLSGIETEMGMNGEFRPYQNSDGYFARGASTWIETTQTGDYTYYDVWVKGYQQDAEKAGSNRADQWEPLGEYFVVGRYNRANCGYYFQEVSTGNTSVTYRVVNIAPDVNKVMMSLSDDYVAPTVLNPTQEWVGDFGAPEDTNLDQLMGNIFEDVADNNLSVEGEVIDIPVPTPTPAPIDPDLPLSDVPWEGLDNNLQQLYEQGLEEIGTIGDARDAITGALGDQTGAIEDAIADNAGVVSGAIDQAVSDVEGAIADNAGVVSGAIEQAVSDVQTAIGEQTAALDDSLSATAEGVETIAEAIEDEEINWRKFDLKGLFPFCIPFDIYNMLKALDASPTAPHVQIPFVIQSIGFSYTLDLDFSAFDPVAAIMRQMELICYGLALAWATSKVIKW